MTDAASTPRWREVAFAVRGWIALVLVGPLVRVLLPLVPTVEKRWAFVRAAIVLLARVGRVPITVEGKPPEGPHVLVVNHESYADGALLIAVSARRLEIAVGAVLARQRVAGPLLERIGCLFVGSPTEAPHDQLARLTAAAARGRLAVFPEGHLVRERELGRFHLGAFVAAASARVDVVPVAIIGSRQLLPPGARRIHPADVVVRYGAPITPEGSSAAAARQLANAAKDAIDALREQPTQ